jgi:hypothetical protein
MGSKPGTLGDEIQSPPVWVAPSALTIFTAERQVIESSKFIWVSKDVDASVV